MIRIGSWLALSLRMQRWEALASVGGSAALVLLMLWIGGQLRSLAAGHAECLDPHTFVAGCEQFNRSFSDLSDWATKLLYLSWGAPFGMGLVLGVPLVARELEQRTAPIAWTLSRSRLGWLLGRLAFGALLTIALLAMIGIVSDLLAAAVFPRLTLESDFTWYGRRGILLVARGVAALAIGTLLGAAIGRVLPGILVAAAASVLVFTTVSLGMDRWLESEAIVLPAMNAGIGGADAGGRSLGTRIELPSGALVTWDELVRQSGPLNINQDMQGRLYDSPDGRLLPDNFIGQERMLLVPGRSYRQTELRESGVNVAAAALLLLLGAAVVSGRRPR